MSFSERAHRCADGNLRSTSSLDVGAGVVKVHCCLRNWTGRADVRRGSVRVNVLGSIAAAVSSER